VWLGVTGENQEYYVLLPKSLHIGAFTWVEIASHL
jgi:hypothetical protein